MFHVVRWTHSFLVCSVSLEDFFLVSLGFSLKLQIGVVLESEAVGPGVLSVAQAGGGELDRYGAQISGLLGPGAGVLLGRGSALCVMLH